MKMETTAQLRNLRMSPRKIRLLTELVKKKNVQDALVQLALKPRAAALPVKKLLDSAVANAVHNHSLDAQSLMIKNIFVDGGATLKRFTPRAFGRASAIHKRTSHITVILEGEVDEKLQEKKRLAKAEKESKSNEMKEAEENHEGHDHVEKVEEKKEPKKRSVKKKSE